jgi:hypothetical protein
VYPLPIEELRVLRGRAADFSAHLAGVSAEVVRAARWSKRPGLVRAAWRAAECADDLAVLVATVETRVQELHRDMSQRNGRGKYGRAG